MKMSTTLAMSVLAMAPSALLAQEFAGAVSLGYAQANGAFLKGDITTKTIDGRIGTSFGNGFSLGARLDSVQGSLSGLSGNVSATEFGLSGAYQLPNNIRFGAYADRAALNIAGISTDLTASSLGLTAGYAVDNANIEAFYGVTTTNPDLPSDTQIHDFGLLATYRVSTKITLGGNLMRTQITSPDGDMRFDTVGVAATYAANDQTTIFGGIRHSTIGMGGGIDLLGDAADATTFGIGLSYDLSSVLQFGSTVSIEYARTEIGASGPSGTLNTIRVGLTIPFGANASKVPLNSVADAVLEPTHSAISTAILTAF